MPLHDWTRADAGLFHDFHTTWLTRLVDALNGGVLPKGYFAMIEQHSGVYVPDVLAFSKAGHVPDAGGPDATAAEPRTEQQVVLRARRPPRRQRRVSVRTARRVVAVVEVVSRGNKDRAKSVRTFAEKVADLLWCGIHVAVVDLLPPGRFDPDGLHPPICKQLRAGAAPGPPAGRPLTFVGYRASDPPVGYLGYAAVGQPIPEVPLFLDVERHVTLPLEQTYQTNYARLPDELKVELES
ncbi:MAG: DUF4058 family protein [Gemmataceae bacterium]|nr:DUF4058 family protein [Gemmataceae bacterium]